MSAEFVKLEEKLASIGWSVEDLLTAFGERDMRMALGKNPYPGQRAYAEYQATHPIGIVAQPPYEALSEESPIPKPPASGETIRRGKLTSVPGR